MKKIVFMLTLALTLAALPSCGESGDKPVFGVAIYKYDDTYISTVRQAFSTYAKGNAELLLNDGGGSQATQNDQIDLLIQKNVDVLLVNIVDVGAAQNVVDKAKAADIPIIFFNREPDESVIKSYAKARFVGTNAKDAGIIQGEIIAEACKRNPSYDRNGDGVIQYVMLKGEPDNPEAVARTEYSVRTAEENGVKLEQLELQVCNWDTELANRAMEAWLTKYGDRIELVIANNDGMAQGAVSALQAAGYNNGDAGKTIPVVGVDATDAAKELISKGYMTGSVLQDGDAMAKALYEIAMNVAQGGDFLDGTSYEYDSSSIAVRIPYRAYDGSTDVVTTDNSSSEVTTAPEVYTSNTDVLEPETSDTDGEVTITEDISELPPPAGDGAGQGRAYGIGSILEQRCAWF